MKKSLATTTRVLALVCCTLGAHFISAAAASTHVDIGLAVGIPLPHGYAEIRVGRERFFYHRGVFYRPGPHGYFVVPAPRGAIIRELPPSYARIYVGGAVYYRYDDVYYRPYRDGYVVVDAPPAVVTARSARDEVDQSVWVGDVEYRFKDGQFFKRTAEGLVWVPAPLGAITKALPADARSVWFQEVEYFECDEVYFRKTPDGYRVVEAPWKKDAAARAK